jgi:hypothetical protein
MHGRVPIPHIERTDLVPPNRNDVSLSVSGSSVEIRQNVMSQWDSQLNIELGQYSRR